MLKRYTFWLLLLAPLLLSWFMTWRSNATDTLDALFSAIVVIFVAGAASVVLTKMLTNEIDLRLLISEENGSASLSRFQFLLFTFVIASSYFLIVIWGLGAGKAFVDGKLVLPDIPTGVLGLIGISGGSYVIAKGIQKSADSGSGAVRTIVVVSGGSGYGAATGVGLTGGGGAGATAVPVIGNGGVIAGVNVTSGGTGYTSAPTVTFSDPGNPPGTGAQATSVI